MSTWTCAGAGVVAGDVRGHPLPAWLRPLELEHQAASDQQRDIGLGAVGAVGPDVARGIARIEQRVELPRWLALVAMKVL
jgi:hypothetical protein